MRKTRKLCAIIVAMTMVLSFTVSASAEGSVGNYEDQQIQNFVGESQTMELTNDQVKNQRIVEENGYGLYSIIDNPEMFIASGTYENWDLVSSNPLDDNDSDKAHLYGVVKLYQALDDDDDYDFWALEMISNIIGKQALIDGDWKKSGISRLRWKVEEDDDNGANSHISRLAPTGTTTSNGQTIDATLAPSFKGVQLGSVGTTFTIWEDTLRTFSGIDYYDIEWEKGSGTVLYPDTVYLNATVEYTADEGTYLHWYWNWYWTTNSWYDL